MNNLLIVADVDGTLLDSRGRLPLSPAELRTRLSRLASSRGVPVTLALASSRTRRELLVLQRALGIAGPSIAEDGAIVSVGDAVLRLGSDRDELRATLRTSAPALADKVLDISDRAALRALGFRTYGAQRRAIGAREASLLLDLATVDEELRAKSIAACVDAQLVVHRGGRWHTVTRGAGKGRALGRLREALNAQGVEPRVIAIGNEENDESLLAASDEGYAINNPGRGVHPLLRALPRVTALRAVGPEGFVEMLERLARSEREEAA